MPKSSPEILHDRLNTERYFYPELCHDLPIPDFDLTGNWYERGEWYQGRLEECSDPVTHLQESANLAILSMYANQDREDIFAALVPNVQIVPGAMEILYVRQKLAEVLEEAAELTPPEWQLCAVDGFRDPRLQGELFESFVQHLQRTEGLTREEAELQAIHYVSRPTELAHHNTGAAIDYTLLYNHQPANMGTKVDAMVPEAALHYYEKINPYEANDPEHILQIRNNRRFAFWLLQAPSILDPNDSEKRLVGIDSEWWHMQMVGTQYGRYVSNDRRPAIFGPAGNLFQLNSDRSVNQVLSA